MAQPKRWSTECRRGQVRVRPGRPTQPTSNRPATTQTPAPRPANSRNIPRQPDEEEPGRSVAAMSTAPQDGHRNAATLYGPPSPSQRTRLLPVTAQPQLTHSEPRVLVLNWPGVIATWHRGQRRVSSLIGHPIRVCGRTHKLTCPGRCNGYIPRETTMRPRSSLATGSPSGW